MTLYLGVSGVAQAGKDTVANVLVENHGFVRISFADALKKAVKALDPILEFNRPLSWFWHEGESDADNWDRLKVEYAEARRLLQRMGTEVGRDLFGENFWVERAFASVNDADRVVFSDCRFPNEAQAVKDHGGYVWRVERPGYGPTNNHPSETSLDHWPFDYVLHNNTSVEGLQDTVADALFQCTAEKVPT